MIISFFTILFLSFINIYIGSFFIYFLIIIISSFFLFYKKKYIIYSLIIFNVFILFFLSTNINKNYIKKKLYNEKKEIKNEIDRLKERVYKNRKKIINKDYPEDSDIGYYIYQNNKLLNWSGRISGFLKKGIDNNPKIIVNNNEADIRFKFTDNDKTIFIRHYLCNLYGQDSYKSQFIKDLESDSDCTINFYFNPGQFYINQEHLNYHDFENINNIYNEENQNFFFKYNNSTIIKLIPKEISHYKQNLYTWIFILNILIINFFLIFYNHDRKILFLFFSLFLINLHYLFINIYLFSLILIFFVILININKLNTEKLFNFSFLNFFINTVFYLTLTLFSFKFLLPSNYKINYLIGSLEINYFYIIVSIFLIFIASLYVYDKFNKYYLYILIAVSIALNIYLKFYMLLLFLIPLFLLIFLIKKKLSQIRIFNYLLYFLILAFISVFPRYFLYNNDIILEAINKVEKEPDKVLNMTFNTLENDNNLLWSLKNNTHYDDTNYAFFKWLKTPLASKDYPNFIYFENKEGEIYSSYAYNCAFEKFSKKPSNKIYNFEDYYITKRKLIENNHELGRIVIGISDTFYNLDNNMPSIYFEHFKNSQSVYSSFNKSYDLKNYKKQIIRNDNNRFIYYILGDFYFLIKYLLIDILIFFIIFIILISVNRLNFQKLLNFKKRILLLLILFVFIPFIFSTILIIKNYYDDIKTYLSNDIKERKKLIVSKLNEQGKYKLSEVEHINEREKQNLINFINKDIKNWYIFSGPKRVLSYNEDVFKVNLKQSYLTNEIFNKLEQNNEYLNYNFKKNKIIYYFKNTQFKENIFKININLSKINKEIFIDNLYLFMFFNIILIVILILFILYITRNFLNPIVDLIIATKKVSYGKFDYNIKSKSIIPEMKILLVNFKSMVSRLKALKNNLKENQDFLNDIIESLPIGAIIYNKNLKINLYNEKIKQNINKKIKKRDISKLFDYDINFRVEKSGILRDKGRVYRYVIKKFKYGYIFMISEITNLILENKFDSWFQMAQEIAHELKNPLMPINISVNRIENLVDITEESENNKKLKELFNIIKEELKNIENLVDRFRDFSYEGEKEISLINPVKRVKKIIKDFNEYPIELKTGSNLPVLYFSKHKFDLILVNLLKNSLEASEKNKKIEIDIYYDKFVKGYSTKYFDSNKKYLIIHMKDYSGGIDKEILDRIFEPYFSNKKEGSGLGLYLVKKYMNQYEGEVFVLNRKNAGIDVYLLFKIKGKK
ncbi:MAG: hypothetical protein FXF47_04450 [Candidatus Mcinerneyibacterium aminivorans]|uniref:histidine kinase n=1 Tax=Candidatus Mcinerneyibacterium aminivorans TaxID=2703815 RepID=A0A5D0MCC7_9BACT|nr:MAG: hypothetical protein FXF47_04450 [Candidatus Mcinerneyibacterium aminivorans]